MDNFFLVQGKESHLELAHLFDKPCFLGPLTMEVRKTKHLSHLSVLVVWAELRRKPGAR